jgi:hypothetical protein
MKPYAIYAAFSENKPEHSGYDTFHYSLRVNRRAGCRKTAFFRNAFSPEIMVLSENGYRPVARVPGPESGRVARGVAGGQRFLFCGPSGREPRVSCRRYDHYVRCFYLLCRQDPRSGQKRGVTNNKTHGSFRRREVYEQDHFDAIGLFTVS